MTFRDGAPALFVGLLIFTVGAIVVELAATLSQRLGRGTGSTVSRARHAARIVAPAALLGAGAILTWLSSTSESPTDANSPSAGGAAAAEPADSGPVTIHADGIGAARVGATLAELRAALPEPQRLGTQPEPFMVDALGLPVTSGADTLYIVLFPTGDPIADDVAIPLVATTWPRARTEAGVGPGVSLAEARVRYGAPTLSYHVMDESREHARFPDQPGDRILFRVRSGSDERAGVYTSPGEHNETTDYDPAARISMVLVHLHP